MTTSDQPMDHVPPGADAEPGREPSELQKNVTAGSTWMRFLFMMLFIILYGVSRVVTGIVVAIQFVNVLLTGEINAQLKSFGHSLAIYSYEVVEYLTFNSETKPFPLDAAWPHELPGNQDAPAATESDA